MRLRSLEQLMPFTTAAVAIGVSYLTGIYYLSPKGVT